MSSNFSTGLELLVMGMLVVFAVLVLLMYIMKIMSAIVNRARSEANQENKQPLQGVQIVSTAYTSEEELAVVAAVMSKVLPKKGIPVRLNIIEVKN